MTASLQRVLRWVYTAALAVAGPLLLAGLFGRSPRLLDAGLLVVMVTPVVGVVIVAVAMALARDWPFTAVALMVLAILGSSLYAASRVSPPASAEGRAAGAPP